MKKIKIAVTGPESTGKTTLAIQLAEHYHAAFVEEAARGYLYSLGRSYDENDLPVIASLQCKAEDRAAATSDLIICDTSLLVIKVWSEYKYGYCHPFILEEMNRRTYDLHLLCNIDINWENDSQREHPHAREELFNIYHNELIRQGVNYQIVTGTGEQRLRNAIAYCNNVIR
jgi:NadR type nicotinamide-nucleotide adenylyltransferase